MSASQLVQDALRNVPAGNGLFGQEESGAGGAGTVVVRARRCRAHDVVAVRDHVQRSDARGDRILLVLSRGRQVDGQRKRQVGVCAVADRYQDSLETRRALTAQHQHVGHRIFEHTFQGGIEVAAVGLLLAAPPEDHELCAELGGCVPDGLSHAGGATHHPAHAARRPA